MDLADISPQAKQCAFASRQMVAHFFPSSFTDYRPPPGPMVRDGFVRDGVKQRH